MPEHCPSNVDGDYVLMSLATMGSDITLNVTGNLTVLALGTSSGQVINLTAGGQILLTADLDVGAGGTISLTDGHRHQRHR